MVRDWLATSFMIFVAFNLVFWWGVGAASNQEEDLGVMYGVVVILYLIFFICAMVQRSFFP